MNKRYVAPMILALFSSAVTVYAASELFHHQLSGPSTTASFGGTLSSNCTANPLSANPNSFSTTSFSTIFQCSGGGAPVTCITPSSTGTCYDSAILSQSLGGPELTGSPDGYSDYNLYLVPHGSTVSTDCASIPGGQLIFQSANPPPGSTGQPLFVNGSSSQGLSYDYCADGDFSQPQGSALFVSWT